MSNIITVNGLKKSFGKVEAVKGISFYVETGKLFAFLGPNGAGKSTTINILCTLLKPDGGEVIINGNVLGKKDEDIRKAIGVVFQDGILDKLLTVRENLAVRAHFYNLNKTQTVKAIDFAAQTADVTEFIDRPYGKLSGGQRRRADIARALINTPKVLFLDEPTTGLDPKTKEGVWKTIIELQRKSGMTVFLTTHYMEEAATADYIIILNHGEIAAKGTPYDLKEQYSSDLIRIKPTEESEIIKLFDSGNIGYTNAGGLITAKLSATRDAIPILEKAKPFIESFEVAHGSMEDAFLNIIGEGAEK